MARKNIEIIKYKNEHSHCTFCLSGKVSRRLCYTKDAPQGRLVSMPLCYGCYKGFVRASLAEKVEEIEELSEEIREERGENFRKARSAVLDLLDILED